MATNVATNVATTNVYILNHLIRRYNLVSKSNSTSIDNVIAELGLKSGANLSNLAKIQEYFMNLVEPCMIIYKSLGPTDAPIDFNINKLFETNFTPTIGINEHVIDTCATITQLAPPISDFKNMVFINNTCKKLIESDTTSTDSKQIIYIIESLNGHEYRLLYYNNIPKISVKIAKLLYFGVELRSEKYNELMETVIIRRAIDERIPFILKDYEVNKKSLPNLDFIKASIQKDLINIFIDKFDANPAKGEKSAKNMFQDIVEKNLSKIIYNNLIANIFSEDKTSESNITFITKISTIITKFNRKFVANLDEMNINNSIFENQHNKIRYDLIGYFKDIIWRTIQEVDSGSGLFKNIEMSLKEFYILQKLV